MLTNVLIGRLNHRSTVASVLNLFTREDDNHGDRGARAPRHRATALQRADTLSGGQQQRVAIARALMQEPKIMLADEPIASLDPSNAKVVMDALRDINEREGITVICNLHTLDTARLLRADHRHGGRPASCSTARQGADPRGRRGDLRHGGAELEESMTSTSIRHSPRGKAEAGAEPGWPLMGP